MVIIASSCIPSTVLRLLMKQDNAPVKAQSYSHNYITHEQTHAVESNWFLLRSNYPSRATLLMALVVQSCWCRLVRSRDFSAPDETNSCFTCSKTRRIGLEPLNIHLVETILSIQCIRIPNLLFRLRKSYCVVKLKWLLMFSWVLKVPIINFQGETNWYFFLG